jgi:hypothetical protein
VSLTDLSFKKTDILKQNNTKTNDDVFSLKIIGTVTLNMPLDRKVTVKNLRPSAIKDKKGQEKYWKKIKDKENTPDWVLQPLQGQQYWTQTEQFAMWGPSTPLTNNDLG